MLEKPLSSSVWWQVENLFDFTKAFAGALFLLVAIIGKIVGSSSSLLEFDEFDDEWTDDSSVLRNDKCDSRSKPNKKSFLCCSIVVRGNVAGSETHVACDNIGSWVLRKFWTVRESLKASLDNFSASISISLQVFGLVSNGDAKLPSNDGGTTTTKFASSLWKVNFSGLISTTLVALFFGARRLKKRQNTNQISFNEMREICFWRLTTWSL